MCYNKTTFLDLGYIVIEYIDLFATVTGVLSVYLSSKNLTQHWPVTVLSCFFAAWLFACLDMYANCFVQAVSCVLSLKGWFSWQVGKASHVRWASNREFLFSILAIIIFTLFVQGIYRTFYELALFDLIAAGFLILGMYSLGRRWVQSWFVFLFLDSCYIFIMIHHGMVFSILKYAMYVYLAQNGARSWSRLARNPQLVAA